MIYSVFERLQLANEQPLVSKRGKFIFQHPREAGALVKVMSANEINRDSSKRNFYKAWRRSGAYTDLLRQLSEYTVLSAKASGPLSSVARIFGLVETDLGPGLMVEKICGADGELAPTLRNILRLGHFSAEMEKQLHHFLAELSGSDAIVNDLNPGNIVYDEDPLKGGRFVLVDGLGDRGLVPICSMSKFVRRWYRKQKFDLLLKRVEGMKAAARRLSKG